MTSLIRVNTRHIYSYIAIAPHIGLQASSSPPRLSLELSRPRLQVGHADTDMWPYAWEEGAPRGRGDIDACICGRPTSTASGSTKTHQRPHISERAFVLLQLLNKSSLEYICYWQVEVVGGSVVGAVASARTLLLRVLPAGQRATGHGHGAGNGQATTWQLRVFYERHSSRGCVMGNLRPHTFETPPRPFYLSCRATKRKCAYAITLAYLVHCGVHHSTADTCDWIGIQEWAGRNTAAYAEKGVAPAIGRGIIR